ncbi:hypothetical protein [Sandaracinus amylolyticus]|uniref:hypothetical protein n=1 Tax=Sandaracinus amylolyticus TaxID=927083 RepID=UPI001F34E2CC|nr:hypothetical protein [Sandaracinus amylolyticus]UJR85239.1 Hypothetical protein I5071_73190 [Sandaracinus amylolyticus]
MTDPIDDLKHRARLLHRAAQAKDPTALARLRALATLRDLDDETLARTVRRAHALAVIAEELGFRSWAHVVAVIRGDDDERDRGTWLYPRECGGHFNVWSASYDEARTIRAEHGGFLLPYRHHFVIVDEAYIETAGLDPKREEWTRIGRDWVQPGDREAYGRLVIELVRARLDAA